uniref:alpha-(1,3)-fucosyltransferase 9-like n=1 Tax=Ciona intestinalis TaxID=7719 RepID=UPI000EF54564|nr:alpha-(1,3)-fucosyltransferase 9-like [Ciona intestinalis]|eukprot:XP_026692635.1 alpha-(1,3)-fucosyltransferase 9-like [Ciona intestinalis]
MIRFSSHAGIKKNALLSQQKGLVSTAVSPTAAKTQDLSPSYILFWVAPFGWRTHNKIDKELCGDCIVTYNQNDLDRAEAVILHFTEAKTQSIPNKSRRKPNQMFTFYSMENPWSVSVYRGISFKVFDNYFNWTMSYRRDSNIYCPYLVWNEEDGLFNGDTSKHYSQQVVKDILSKKQSNVLAWWLVSNCGATHGGKIRKVLIREMENAGLTIDKKGGCFGKRFTQNAPAFGVKYKFYLAFENGVHCRDYITEKLWSTSFEGGVVPVVWGSKREDIEAIAPVGSFIFYEDYNSSAELVKYLQYLNTNDTAYAEYFNWRLKQPTIEEFPLIEYKGYRRNAGLCQMCRLLRQKKLYNNVSNVVASLEDWWNSDNPECLSSSVKPHDKFK